MKRLSLLLLAFTFTEDSSAWLATRMRKRATAAAPAGPIAVVGVSMYTGAGDNSAAMPLPAGVASGHVLYALLWNEASGAITITPPSGWTLVGSNTSTNNNGKTDTITILRKIAGGAEPTSYTFTYSAGTEWNMWNLVAYSGVNLTTPEDAAPAYTSGFTSGGAPVATASITTVTNGARVIAVYSEPSGSDAITAPTGYAGDFLNVDTGRTQLFSGYGANQATAGATGPVTTSGWTDGYGYATAIFALRPQ